jgi:hypothetical protein
VYLTPTPDVIPCPKPLREWDRVRLTFKDVLDLVGDEAIRQKIENELPNEDIY